MPDSQQVHHTIARMVGDFGTISLDTRRWHDFFTRKHLSLTVRKPTDEQRVIPYLTSD